MLLWLAVYLAVHQAIAYDDFAQLQKAVLCDLGCKCPEPGQSLMFLDCSRRGISNLPTSLRLESTVTSVSFQINHIEKLHMSTFSIADQVQEADFSLNQISEIDNFTFVPFSSLTRLCLSRNRLSHLEEGLLNGLSNLRLLELGHNIIQKIDHRMFRATPNLQELKLQYNPVFNLPENTFQYLPRLERLDLQDTGLVMLPNDIFLPTPRLHSLSLATNAFENVPEEALSKATMLETLNLSENDFTILVDGDFRRLANISVVYLNSLSRLSRIERNALAGMQKLKCLSCSYNPKLYYIDENAFGSNNSNTSIKTPPREQLYLRQNGLRTLKSPLDAKSWSSLSYVDLAGNPWKCDCFLLWMKELNQEVQANIKCDSPHHLRGRAFNTIEASELQCGRNWAIATFALVVAAMIGFGGVMLAVTAVVCSRTPVGLYIRSKKQFSYAKVTPKIETVDLEWDPSADTL